MGHKTLIGGTSYDAKSGRTLIGGTGYDIKKGQTLIDGTGYDISFGTPVGELPVGSSVFMNVDGVRTEFLIINQGYEPAGYSCDTITTWVLSKYALDQVENDMSDSMFGKSPLYNYISNFTTKLDEPIASLLSEISYKVNISADTTLYSTKAVILTSSDINETNGSSTEDPVPLQYFENASDTDRLLPYINSTASYVKWHVRDISMYAVSPYYRPRYVNTRGSISTSSNYYITCYVRPALAFLPKTFIDSEFNIIE